MTVFLMQPGLPANEMKRSVSIMAHENGHDIPAMTLIAGNPDFPISDLNQLALMMTAALMGQPLPAHSGIGDARIHFAQAENGHKIDNGYKLRYRTPNSGVTAEEGVFIAINKALPPVLLSEVHERMNKAMRTTLNAYHAVTATPSADSAPTLQI